MNLHQNIMSNNFWSILFFKTALKINKTRFIQREREF